MQEQNFSKRLRLDPQLLISFLAVARVGKIAQASQYLNLSQPAVTAQIRRLEEQLSVTLFRRSVRGVELTTEGRAFQEKAKIIVDLIESSVSEMINLQQPEGHLAIAASTTIGAHILPSILMSFAQKFEKTSFSLSISNTDEVIQKVRKGEIPIGLVEGLSKASGVRTQKFILDELFAVSIPSVASKVKKVSDLSQFPILWRERGSGTRSVVEKSLKSMGLDRKKLNSRFELGSTEAIITAVKCGSGIAFLSKWSIQNELNSNLLSVIPLTALKIPRLFSWVLPSGGLAGTAKAFFDFAEIEKSRSLGFS